MDDPNTAAHEFHWEVAFVNWGRLPATAVPPGWEPFQVTCDDEDGVTIWIRRLVK
jgi:hypothetical protein